MIIMHMDYFYHYKKSLVYWLKSPTDRKWVAKFRNIDVYDTYASHWRFTMITGGIFVWRCSTQLIGYITIDEKSFVNKPFQK